MLQCMASARQTENTPQRKATRPVRRQQLIDSTIAVLARKGYAGLTVADVAKEAGLSAGIVIFHFNSKDELLAAVLGALGLADNQFARFVLGGAFDMLDMAAYLAGGVVVVAVESGLRRARRGQGR